MKQRREMGVLRNTQVWWNVLYKARSRPVGRMGGGWVMATELSFQRGINGSMRSSNSFDAPLMMKPFSPL